MLTPFLVKGLNPGTGRLVELVLMAKGAEEARRLAEACGLHGVTLDNYALPDPPSSKTRRGTRDDL